MYKRDCNAIAQHALASPDGLVDVVEFTLCSIQAGLSTIKQQRRDIKANGLQSKFLWGKKADGLDCITRNKVWFWSYLSHKAEVGDNEAIADAILELMKVPNLGMVKAAFVCQMLGMNVACLDSHNIKRLGLTPSAVKVDAKLKPEKKRAKVLAYIELCQKEGTEYWWNTWCNHVAGNSANRRLNSGDLVSAYHVEAVTMKGD
jgi:hypothetical protein